MSDSTKRLLIAGLIVSLSKLVPYGSLLIYPIALLSTWTHEMGHGLTAMMTGGSFLELKVFFDTTGLAITKPNMGITGKVLIYNAGYIATSLLGFFMLRYRFDAEISNSIFLLLGCSILFSQFFWVKDFESHFLCAFLILLLFIIYRFNIKSEIVLNIIALALCLDSIESIAALFSDDLVLAGIESSHSDPGQLRKLTFIPESFWILLWLLASAVFFYYGIKMAKKKPDKSPAP